MKRQYRHTYTVRYDECDWYGFLTPTAFARYLQNIAALDAEDAHLAGNGYWIVKRTLISFASPILVHTPLSLTTYGIGFTRITAQRGYDASIAGEDHHNPVISARSLWVYMDTRGRPARLPEQTVQIWLPDGPLPQQPEAPWPIFPQTPPETITYQVRFSDTDRMHHMNNAAYIELLDDAAWEAYRKSGIQPDTATIHVLDYDIEYGDSARLGESLEIETWFDPFPSPGKDFSRLQQIKRDGTVLVRARSRWHWA